MTGLNNREAIKYMSAASRGAVVERNRTFFTSSKGVKQAIDAVTEPSAFELDVRWDSLDGM